MAVRWGAGGYLRINSAAPAAQGYLPSDNPASLIAWFRMGVGVTITGAGVSSWADQSGNGNDLLQGTDGNRPDYDGTAIITFNGSADFLKCSAFTLNQPTQVSILASQVTWTNNDTLWGGNVGAQVGLTQRVISPNVALFAGNVEFANSDMTVGAFHAVTSLLSGASSSIVVDANAATTGSPGTTAMAGFTLGSRGDGLAGWSNIAVKEIILRNVDDATIRANDQTYLLSL